jgi:class 3 adenylate cyclase
VLVSDEGPETQYASVGVDRIAFQVFGDGDVDLLIAMASGDPIDMCWYWPPYAEFLQQLGTQARVIMFDKRGSGSSDRVSSAPLSTWEQWADDAHAVLDAVESQRAVLLGVVDGGPGAILFAASHPTRTRALILANTAASFSGAETPEVPTSWDPRYADEAATREFIEGTWGTPAFTEVAFPDAARDPAFVRYATRANRLSYSPSNASEVLAWQNALTDVRHVLSSVRVPTLVLHREGLQLVPLDHGRYLAERIDDAQFAVLPGRDAHLFSEPVEPGLKQIAEFLRGLRETSDSDRALAAILFTDFVGSTQHLATLGDHAWRNILDSHDAIARTVVEQHSGRLIKTTGDGILATFDGPGRAIRCSIALRDSLRPLGVEIRAGLHTGEVEIRGDDIAGIAVHIAARVLDSATGGELLVSPAVPMLVAGAGFEFDDRGHHELKGIDGTWQLFAVRA